MVNYSGKQDFNHESYCTYQEQYIPSNDTPPVLNNESFGGAENTMARLRGSIGPLVRTRNLAPQWYYTTLARRR